jgi:hypothetical protein
MENTPIFYCPKCGTPAERCEMIGTRTHTTEVPGIPYFICGKCRSIFVNKRLVRETMHGWWRRNRLKRIAPFTKFYDDAIEQLDTYVVAYFKNIGYTPMRFIKKQPL